MTTESTATRAVACNRQEENPVDEFRSQAKFSNVKYDLAREPPMESSGQHFESYLCNDRPDPFGLVVNRHEIMHLAVCRIQPSVGVDTNLRFIISENGHIRPVITCRLISLRHVRQSALFV